MSEPKLRVGQKVEVAGKNIRGEVAYIGMTTFAAGKWAGVVLTEPKGKNNGTIQGTAYFTCPENHGMFVRPTQLVPLDDAGNPIQEAAEEKPQRSRLSSSRVSLAGSRQSLSGSRTQLSSTPSERTTPSQSTTDLSKKAERRTMNSPPESVMPVSSKRESFVETGFLETLKPQFTPGHPITSPALTTQHSVEEKINLLQLQQENEDLRNQIRDLTEKLDTLKQRRTEDKERFREFEKMQTQFEQMQEFKLRIMEAQSQLQRELQRARQETKDAIDEKNRHAEEMSELAENVELITLDKEMAEEKADFLNSELDAAKERIEELTLDLQIIKAEMENRIGEGGITDVTSSSIGTGGGAGVVAAGGEHSFKITQLTQQNERLRDALVKMRDLSAHERHELQKMTKELETKTSEVNELQQTKEKLSIKIDELETQLIDLHEQVDAALGADEMVEQLAEKKMELEDKVKLLEEEIRELEALEEVHEQLVESSHENEMDLREELDMVQAAKREMQREKDAAIETILDRDQTILKFRDLVHKLNEQITELRDRASNAQGSKIDTNKSNANQIVEAIDFKQMFAESKAYTRAIDLQLRQIELSQATEHVRLLTSFMPSTFMSRGGDYDAIQINLLISRIISKTEIIVGQARERFPAVGTIERNAVVQGHTVQQFAFKSRLLYHIYNLTSVMHQFLFGLNSCTPDLLLKAGQSLPEMLAQEKVIDGIVELLKANQLDENSSTDNLEKAVLFFNAIYSVLFGAEANLLNETQLVRDSVSSIQSACDSITTDSAMIQSVIKGGDETSESGLLLQYALQNADSIRQQLKLIKRRLPQDSSVIRCGLSDKTILTIRQTNEQLGKVMNTLFNASKSILHSISSTAAEATDISSVTVPNTKIMDLLAIACEKVYEQDDRGPSQNLKTALSATNTDIAQLAQYLLDNEYEILSVTSTAKQDKPQPPITLRAQFVKKQMEETKALKATVENREADIRQLKVDLKLKVQELSDMQYRKDLAEKKVSVIQQEFEKTSEKLQRQRDDIAEQLKKKEKEYEEGMNHLQKDIDSLESERHHLRENLKAHSTKKGDVKQPITFDTASSTPFVAQELSILKKALQDERAERIRIQATEMEKILKNLKPIHVPQPKDNRINELERDLIKVKHDYIISLANGSKIPKGNTSQTNISKLLYDQQNKQRQLREEIKARVEQLSTEVVHEYLRRKPHRAIKGDFATFPTNELTRTLIA
ncbi:dynactin subunit 1 isoform X2 [Contarinia nasturtii]|uniref:dynactin subunit 1 isoform X2 n=1 Tax=Contarinia nasturtii TaxID=265458 RepID=UPI0012D40E82|nr:dynactin subunit 1 isoform X2 [Contarinia nasturtii]